MNQNQQVQNYESDINQLNSFLKDERAAVETYRQCIDKLDDPEVLADLSSLQDSHQRRVAMLSEKVKELGGTPEAESGMWGTFAKMVEGSARMLGSKSALAALEEGEDKGRDNYESKADKLSTSCQAFINGSVLPEQRRSHDDLNKIINRLH